MFISPLRLKKFGLNVNGVLHIGCHLGEEASSYISQNWTPIYWVDAQADLLAKAKEKLLSEFPNTNQYFFQGVVSSESGNLVDFLITNNGQSSSIFKLANHKVLYPDIVVTSKLQMRTKRIDELVPDSADFNFLNIDIQGGELAALMGLGDLVRKIDYIYTEVNRKELYANIPLVTEIDEYLRNFGFMRKITYWVPFEGWGDALYVKQFFNHEITIGQKIKIFFTQMIFRASYFDYFLLHKYLKKHFYNMIFSRSGTK